MADSIPVFILSYQRPLYLWTCLDSLFRHTTYPCKFILADNASPDPQVREVIRAFERRGMFYDLHLCETNDPGRVLWLLRKHRALLPAFFSLVESDVFVASSDPCWLSRYVRYMETNPKLGMLGSLIDPTDFISMDAAKRLCPEMTEADLTRLIKGNSPERQLAGFEGNEGLIRNFNNPPGRLLMIRTETLDVVPYGRDSHWNKNMLKAGYETATAADVRHRHLSLLNLFDYHNYDINQRDAYFKAHNPEKRLFGADEYNDTSS